MKALASGLLLSLIYPALVAAQGRDRAIERISLALDQSAVGALGWTAPASDAPKTIGIFTLLPPTGRGEILRVSVPIGDLVSRAIRSAASANRRRHESAARREVEAELESFKKRQTPRQ
jgi:hypothetical protein